MKAKELQKLCAKVTDARFDAEGTQGDAAEALDYASRARDKALRILETLLKLEVELHNMIDDARAVERVAKMREEEENPEATPLGSAKWLLSTIPGSDEAAQAENSLYLACTAPGLIPEEIRNRMRGYVKEAMRRGHPAHSTREVCCDVEVWLKKEGK